MYFKRWSPVVALALCATLAACGGNNDENNKNVNPNNMTTNVNPNNMTTNVNPNNQNCDGVSTCDTPGSSCAGSSAVVCAADADGCLVETSTDCTAASQMCMGGACVDVEPCTDDAACAGVAEGGRFCTGDVLTTCADNGAGCLVASTNDCAASGESCDMDTQACVGTCVDDAACAGLADGDTFCDGAGYTTCAANGQGCLIATPTACNAGEVCDDTSGSAACAGSCAEAIQTISCADAGSTIMVDSANGTNVVTENACDSFSTYDANEVFIVFQDTANYEVTVDFTYDNANINEVDLFALSGTGMCTDPGLTCEGQDYGFSGSGSLDFEATGNQPYYLLFEPYSATGETTGYGISITCIPVVCGDGAIGAGEDCDDGNATDGDGCDMNCAVEADYVCTGSPSACVPDVCGDGMLSPNEACDDSNVADGDGCDMSCDVEFGYECDDTGANCALYPSIGTFAADAAIPSTMGGPVPASECDFHSITFSDTSVVSGSVTGGTTGDRDVYIFTQKATYHRGESTGDETFSDVVLAPGTYVIAVCGYGSEVDAYTLALTTTALNTTDIGTFASMAAITNTTGSLADGTTVFYTITFSDDVLLSGTLTADTGNGNLRVLFGDGSPYAAFATVGDETFNDVRMPAGTYMLAVTAAAGGGDIGTYTLALSTAPLADTYLGSFAAGDTIMDQTGASLFATDSDYYLITFSTDVSLTGSLTATAGDADLVIFGANGVQIVGFQDGDESFAGEMLTAGSYLIRIAAYTDVSGYTLALAPN